MTTKTVGLLPADIEQMTFASLGGRPILYSAKRSYALTTTPRGREWTVVDQSAAGQATVLDEREFFMSFGSDLPPLPEPMRKFDHRLWLVDQDGLVFSRFQRKARRSQDPTAEFGAPADRVTALFQKPKIKRTKPARKKTKAKRKPADEDEFYLGHHQYTFGPGCGWATEYRISRLDDGGENWEIFSVYECDVGCEAEDEDDDTNSRFQSMGKYTTEQAKAYFDSVHFEISDEKWRQMGCRNGCWPRSTSRA